MHYQIDNEYRSPKWSDPYRWADHRVTFVFPPGLDREKKRMLALAIMPIAVSMGYRLEVRGNSVVAIEIGKYPTDEFVEVITEIIDSFYALHRQAAACTVQFTILPE